MIIEQKKSDTMANLSDKIKDMIDPKDPNQRLLGLIVILIESRFEDIETKIDALDKKIDKQEIINTNHSLKCPRDLEKRVEIIEGDIDWIQTLAKYKYMLILVIAGVATMIKLGLDKIISYL